jgi:hypothetical protein
MKTLEASARWGTIGKKQTMDKGPGNMVYCTGVKARLQRATP